MIIHNLLNMTQSHYNNYIINLIQQNVKDIYKVLVFINKFKEFKLIWLILIIKEICTQG